MEATQLFMPRTPFQESDVAFYDQQKLAREQLRQNQDQFNAKLDLYKQMLGNWNQQTSGLNNLLNQYNQAYAQAKFQNEQKYNQQLGLVDQVSGQQRADTISGFQNQQAEQMQNAARLGMSNVLSPSIKTGIQREQQSALNRLADQMLGTKLGVMQGFNYQGMDPNVTQAAISALAPKLPTFSL